MLKLGLLTDGRIYVIATGSSVAINASVVVGSGAPPPQWDTTVPSCTAISNPRVGIAAIGSLIWVVDGLGTLTSLDVSNMGQKWTVQSIPPLFQRTSAGVVLQGGLWWLMGGYFSNTTVDAVTNAVENLNASNPEAGWTLVHALPMPLSQMAFAAVAAPASGTSAPLIVVSGGENVAVDDDTAGDPVTYVLVGTGGQQP